MGDKYIIRTSDRKHFKECRRAWNWSSKIRQDLEPNFLRPNLDFGSAFHAALENYYAPETWDFTRREDTRIPIELNTTGVFMETMYAMETQLMARQGELSPEDEEKFAELRVLGQGMLDYFYRWSPEHDDMRPIHVEVEFEVPIVVPNWAELPPNFDRVQFFDNPTSHLFYMNRPVEYQGRIDIIWQDSKGFYWIGDHKTAGQLRDDMSFLDFDEQCKSYAWAVKHQLGIDAIGVIYSEHYKGVPAPPQMNQNQRQGRWYSVNKQQDTTYELYLDTVSTQDVQAFEHGLYDEMLNYLKAEGKKYIRREKVLYNPESLRRQGESICLEAIDMLNQPSIYPNPTRFGCQYCDYRTPCLAQNDGSDFEWFLQEHYTRRSDVRS